jgi:hypothetical protein
LVAGGVAAVGADADPGDIVAASFGVPDFRSLHAGQPTSPDQATPGCPAIDDVREEVVRALGIVVTRVPTRRAETRRYCPLTRR